MRIRQYFGIYYVLCGLLFSCVPVKKYEELNAKQKSCRDENSALKTLNQNLEEKNKELAARFVQTEARIKTLKEELESEGKKFEVMSADYDNLKQSYQLLVDNNNSKSAKDKQARDKLIVKLQETQESLQAQEDALRAFESSLSKKELDLKKLTSDLEAREKRVKELEDMINKKDQLLTSLKEKVKDALLGFENKGLTIEQKDGKVYVSLDESLLFASGSYKIGDKGKEVLKKLAKVLEQNEDIDVLVEGHTDNVPLNGTGDIKDNWDLSVKRATSVVKIITENSGTSPKRLTAAGRGEYLPIDLSDTVEGRRKNRRIEVILIPKLDELLELLESN